MIDVDLIIKSAVHEVANEAFSANYANSPYLINEADLQAQLFRRLINQGYVVLVEYAAYDKKRPDLVLFEKDKCSYQKTKKGDPERFDVKDKEYVALIELKLFWLSESKESIIEKLKEDKEQLLKLEVTSPLRYVIGFDYWGKLTEEDIKSLASYGKASILYVNVKNKKVYSSP